MRKIVSFSGFIKSSLEREHARVAFPQEHQSMHSSPSLSRGREKKKNRHKKKKNKKEKKEILNSDFHINYSTH